MSKNRLAAALMLFPLTTIVVAQQTPGDWRLRTDTPAKVEAGEKLSAGAWRFVTMAPGWHITTSPGALLSAPSRLPRANFRLEAEMFLFPGTSEEGYGLFLGGTGIEPATATPAYVAFLVRRDGRAAVLRITGTGSTPIVDWKVSDGVIAHPGGDTTAKNVLRLDGLDAEIVFAANGKEIARVPRAGIDTAGAFGFRVGRDLNLHISTLDVTERLAPIPVKRGS